MVGVIWGGLHGWWPVVMSDVCNLLMADGGWYVVAGRAANPRSPRGAWRGALRGGARVMRPRCGSWSAVAAFLALTLTPFSAVCVL